MSQQVAGETMAAALREHLPDDETVEVVCHCAQNGPLGTARDEWIRYDSLADLPARELRGWEELVVFTAERIYRQVGIGYGGEVRVAPRTPAALVERSATSGTASAAADDD